MLWWFLAGGSSLAQRIATESYLKDKYGKDFVVSNYRVEGSGIGIEGDPTADAYPKEDRTLKFEVIDRGRFKEGQHAYSDDYPGAVWSREENENIKPKLKEIFGYLPEYELNISTLHDLDGQISGEFGSFMQASQKYGEKITYVLRVKANKPFDEENIAKTYLRLKEDVINRNAHISVLSYANPINETSVRGIALGNEDIKAPITQEQLKSRIKVWSIR